MTDNYENIIHLPHHVSTTHSPMPLLDRAAQFSPFAALSGYDSAVKETARLTDKRIELSEDKKAVLTEKLRIVEDMLDERPEVTITYFLPDTKKAGGAYVSVTGRVKKIDANEQIVCMTGGMEIPLGDVIEIEGEFLPAYFDEEE